MQLAIRISGSLVAELDALVPDVHPTRAEAVRVAVTSYLYRLACERDAQRYAKSPLTDEELSLTDDIRGWESTPPW
ncbi:MAG: hypothetical protein M3507_10000 [Actinomycetota bacterium]|jgi:metal-responsive CopG/Arc/MetJ family transcriptional regulator|nr:hypothetical protein [Actinomycetota bacterium]